jgi:predicted transcriptional regulator
MVYTVKILNMASKLYVMTENVKKTQIYTRKPVKSMKEGAKDILDDTLVLRFETVEEVLTPRRKELINTIKNEEVSSVTELSELVGRDKSRVSKDLKELYETDIIEFEEVNGGKSPELKHDIIDIEPIVLGE